MSPIYIFQTEAGEYVERFYGMADAPMIGESVPDPDDAGSMIRRCPSVGVRSAAPEYRHVAHSLPRVHDPLVVAAQRELEAKREKDPVKREELLRSAAEWRGSQKVWKHTTKDGKPVFTSKAQVQEFAARVGGRVGWSQD